MLYSRAHSFLRKPLLRKPSFISHAAQRKACIPKNCLTVSSFHNLKLSTYCKTMADTRSSDYLVWVDLEMTGLDLSKDHIIEMACIITDKDLNVVAEVRSFHLFDHPFAKKSSLFDFIDYLEPQYNY